MMYQINGWHFYSKFQVQVRVCSNKLVLIWASLCICFHLLQINTPFPYKSYLQTAGEKLMGNINSFRIMQISLQLYRRGGIKHRTKEESIHQHTHTQWQKVVFLLMCHDGSCRQPRASLSIVIARDLSVCWAAWPDSPDRAPTVSLHMPELSLRDTALSEGIHCTHEKQAKRTQPAQQGKIRPSACISSKYDHTNDQLLQHIYNCKVQSAGFGNI